MDDVSVIDLTSYHPQTDRASFEKFSIDFSLQEYKNLNSFCRNFTTDSQAVFWLSWKLFDRVFQSESFSVASGNSLKNSRDIVRVKATLDQVRSSLLEEFPLSVYLCTEGLILASAQIAFNLDSLHEQILPFSMSNWFEMEALDARVLASCSLRATVDVKRISPERSAARFDANIPTTDSLISTQDYEEDESFERVEEDVFSRTPVPLATGAPVIDLNLHHLRMSVIVRSIKDMKRSSHAYVHFVYPYLGTKSSVRSSPLWVPANTETDLANASVTYDTVLTWSAFQDIATEHPLLIHLKEKSHMGANDIGHVEVNYANLLAHPPHSYRCSTTKKTFTSMDDFIAHRNAINLLNLTGKTKLQVPSAPVELYVLDSYFDVMSSSDGGKLRVVVVVEKLGAVGYEMGVPVRPGYSMHAGGVYTTGEASSAMPSEDAVQDTLMAPIVQSSMDAMKIEWENWRRDAENTWRENLREKEATLKKALEEEAATVLAAKADDLRRAHEEAGRLEVRLRTAIDAVDKQRVKLSLKEDQANMKLAQKSSELQLLERRIREEARGKVESETRRADGLERTVEALKESIARMEKRAKDAEKDFESHRAHVRAMPETQLREEVCKLRAQLAETRTEIERERRLGAETELEKEHFRAQMYRLASALKKERERGSATARQELEQLRLEFLSREERYVLDGDREELRNIRKELSQLRFSSSDSSAARKQMPVEESRPESDKLTRLRKKKSDLLESGYREGEDPVIAEINDSITKAEQYMEPPRRY